MNDIRSGQIRILIADDEPLVRAGIIGILGTEPDLNVVCEAATGREALDMTRSRLLDVAVLDIRMPELSGLEVLRELRRDNSTLPCLIVTTFGEDDYVSEAMNCGADGFVLKSGDPRELILAVRAVAEGGAYFSPAVARRLLTDSTVVRLDRKVRAQNAFRALTTREQDVIQLIGRGMSNADIAAELHLAEGTVKVHITSILRTTGARNRVQAALIAVHADET
ncbi:response regulator [Rhodococcus sp. 06-235-1A]|uniref:response regulator n=1 Tax=Rhodococcus sp. 06-235-1A TaxID=2022508 RepID=UPI00211AEA1D|nr:response regulator transcription factor [Rhodococcus sp. 06-235-1A]